jgi:hypothetical protein
LSKLIRRYLIPALIAALAGTGVSFAATGSVVPFQHETTQVSDQQDDTTTEVAPKGADDPAVEVTDQDENESDDEQGSAETEESQEPVRSTEGCGDFTGNDGTFNHGQFVSQSEDKQAAAHSPCGKPIHSDENEAPEVEENEGHGQGEQHRNDAATEHAHEDEGDSE